MKKGTAWGALLLLTALALAFWPRFRVHPASSQPLMPTFVPTPVEPTALPDTSFRAPTAQRLDTLLALKGWMATHLYPKGRAFLQQAAGQWVNMEGRYRRFTPPGSRLLSEGHMERWIHLDTQGKIQELLVVEKNPTGDIVQITYARGDTQWNSLGGRIPGGGLSLEELIGWKAATLWDEMTAAPLIGQENASTYTLIRRVRYVPPIRRFGEYTVQGREEVWAYDKRTGLLSRHQQRMHLQDGSWITLWDVQWTYTIQPHLPEQVRTIYEHAVTQWKK